MRDIALVLGYSHSWFFFSKGVSSSARWQQADLLGRLSPVRDPGVRESARPGDAANGSFERSNRPDSFLRARRPIVFVADDEGALVVAGDDLGVDRPHETSN